MLQLIAVSLTRIWPDRRGQDMIEYALTAAFVAVAASAVFPPSITPAISSIYSKITSVLAQQP